MSPQYFFVVGAPRSGTTMLQQALNRHSQIAIPPETAFFTLLRRGRAGQRQHWARTQADLGIELALPDRLRDDSAYRHFYGEMARHYLGRLGRRDITHFGEKSPEHRRRLTDIRRLFPDSKIVLIYRDGRDVALSLSKVPWMPADLYLNFALWLHYCRLQEQATRRERDRLLCVRYETLVAEPAAELRRVLAFLGLPYEPDVAEGAGNVEGVPAWEHGWKRQALERISTSPVGRWRKELTPIQAAILERWGGHDLQSLGYELSTGGEQPLPWLFRLRVYARALWWLLVRPRYSLANRRRPVADGRCRAVPER
jgi:hypothetical protein